MAASPKYRGLCETCDYDATCKLKRSPRLEIIHCEKYFAQPIMYRRTPRQEDVVSSMAPQDNDATDRRIRSAWLKDPF